MGVNESAINHGYITEKDLNLFADKSHFTKKQILFLAAKYRQISKDSSITLKDFADALSISKIEIAEIIYKIIDSDGSGSISFPEFIEGLNKVHPDEPFDNKVMFCFQAYDADSSGAVSADEIKSVIKISLQDNPYVELNEAQINDLVRNLIKQYNRNGTGELNFHEFYEMVSKARGVIECFNIDLHTLCDVE